MFYLLNFNYLLINNKINLNKEICFKIQKWMSQIIIIHTTIWNSMEFLKWKEINKWNVKLKCINISKTTGECPRDWAKFIFPLIRYGNWAWAFCCMFFLIFWLYSESPTLNRKSNFKYWIFLLTQTLRHYIN